MSRFVTTDEPYNLLGWAAAQLGHETIWPPESHPLAIVEGDGTIHAVVVYNAFYDNSCHMHIATARTRRWATRQTLQQIFGYPFARLGLSRVNVQIAVSNIQTQITCLKLGFTYEGTKRAAFDGEDAVMMGMQRRDCRFIPQPTPEIDGQDASLRDNTHEANHGKEFRVGA